MPEDPGVTMRHERSLQESDGNLAPIARSQPQAFTSLGDTSRPSTLGRLQAWAPGMRRGQRAPAFPSWQLRLGLERSLEQTEVVDSPSNGLRCLPERDEALNQMLLEENA